jgi:hypothetical protein
MRCERSERPRASPLIANRLCAGERLGDLGLAPNEVRAIRAPGRETTQSEVLSLFRG